MSPSLAWCLSTLSPTVLSMINPPLSSTLLQGNMWPLACSATPAFPAVTNSYLSGFGQPVLIFPENEVGRTFPSPSLNFANRERDQDALVFLCKRLYNSVIPPEKLNPDSQQATANSRTLQELMRAFQYISLFKRAEWPSPPPLVSHLPAGFAYH